MNKEIAEFIRKHCEVVAGHPTKEGDVYDERLVYYSIRFKPNKFPEYKDMDIMDGIAKAMNVDFIHGIPSGPFVLAYVDERNKFINQILGK